MSSVLVNLKETSFTILSQFFQVYAIFSSLFCLVLTARALVLGYILEDQPLFQIRNVALGKTQT